MLLAMNVMYVQWLNLCQDNIVSLHAYISGHNKLAYHALAATLSCIQIDCRLAGSVVLVSLVCSIQLYYYSTVVLTHACACGSR